MFTAVKMRFIGCCGSSCNLGGSGLIGAACVFVVAADVVCVLCGSGRLGRSGGGLDLGLRRPSVAVAAAEAAAPKAA